MAEYFDICGAHILMSSIKDFRVINVEFVYRPVFQECRKNMLSAFSGRKYEFSHMEPYAAIIGQQGHKSELGDYKAKDFKEAVAKDLSGAVIYTIADKLKLKAFKRQQYQCISLAGRPFTAYLDDIPAKMIWSDGRIAEVYKEDELYSNLHQITMPGVEYASALIIKANEIFCFYGNGIQLADANAEFERLKQEQALYLQERNVRKTPVMGKISLPPIPRLHLPGKTTGESDPLGLGDQQKK